MRDGFEEEMQRKRPIEEEDAINGSSWRRFVNPRLLKSDMRKKKKKEILDALVVSVKERRKVKNNK